MELKDFENLVLNRQSCRKFSDKPVEKEKLVKAVEVALKAPSACNSQPWKLYCVTDPKKLKEVANCLQDEGKNLFTSEAKSFIAISERTRPLKSGISSRFSEDHFVKYDIGEIISYLTLALKAEGLDSCIIGWVNVGGIKKVLSIPDDETCNIVLAIGYSGQPLREKVRLDSKETVKYI